jgi:hypothetical protein
MIETAQDAVRRMERMERWVDIRVLNQTARQVIKALPDVTEAVENQLMADWADVSERTGPNMGNNLWALHEVLTMWASNKLGKTKLINTTRVTRQKKVAAVVNSNLWAELEAPRFQVVMN